MQAVRHPGPPLRVSAVRRAAALLILGLLLVPRASRARLRVVQAGPAGLALEWAPGPEETARLVPVAVPPRGSARLVEVADAATGLALAPRSARAAVAIDGHGWRRRQPLAQLLLDPAGLPPGATVRVALAFDRGPEPPRAAGRLDGAPPSAAELELAARFFVNGEQARAFLVEAARDATAWAPAPAVASRGRLLRRLPLSLADGAEPVDAGPRRLDAPGRWRSVPRAGDGLEAGRVKILVDRGGLDRDGIYRVRHDDLAAAGMDVTGTPIADLRLRRSAAEPAPVDVAMRVVDADADGLFGPGDHFDFYGRALLHDERSGFFQRADFGDTGAYFLDAVPGGGARMEVRDAAPNPGSPLAEDFLQSAHAEVDNWFLGNHRTGSTDVDHFYWCPSLLSFGLTEREEAVSLPGLAGAGSAREVALRVRLLTRYDNPADPDHRSRVDLNGVSVSDQSADGPAIVTHEVAGLAAGDLSDPSLVRLSLVDLAGVDQRAELDWIEIDYPRLFEAVDGQLSFQHEGGVRARVGGLVAGDVVALDVTDPDRPVLLEGVEVAGGTVELELLPGSERHAVASFPGGSLPVAPLSVSWVPESDLLDRTNAAGMLVVGPRAWLEPPSATLQAYVDLRESQGLPVRLVPVEEVFDELGGGVLDPFALQRLLGVAVNTWAGPPEHVLLVGDANVDFKDVLGGRVLFPTECAEPETTCELFETDWVQHVPTRVFDAPDDNLFLGHFASDSVLSAVSGADVVPDVNVGRLPVRSRGELDGILQKILDYEAAAAAPPAWGGDVIMVADAIDPDVPSEVLFRDAQDEAHAESVAPYYGRRTYYHEWGADRAIVRDPLLLDWDGGPGAAVMSYVGHGNPFQWSNDLLVTNRDLAACVDDTEVLGAAPPPLVLNVGCVSAAFIGLNDASLLEDLVRQPTGGAIAAYGPTGTTDSSVARSIVGPFYRFLHGRDGRGWRLGDAIWQVQASLAGGLLFDDVLGNALLGDPAMNLAIPHGPPGAALEAVGGDGVVDLSWDPVPGAGSYVLYRSQDGEDGPWTPIPVGDVTAHPDADVTNSVLYTYALEPVSPEGWPGRWSAFAEARPCSSQPPERGGEITVTPLQDRVFLSWDPSPTPGVRYVVIVHVGGPEGGVISEFTSAGFATVEGIVPCVGYAFEVLAENACGVRSTQARWAEHRGEPCPVEVDLPDTIRDLRLAKTGTSVRLSWSPIARTWLGEPLEPVAYQVFRSEDVRFPAEAATRIARPAAGPYNDRDRLLQRIRLEFYAVAAEAPDGTLGAVGHEPPQGVEGVVVEDAGGGMDRVSWEAVLRDSWGAVTAIREYEVHGSDAPLSRSDAGPATLQTTVPGLSATVPARAFHVVVAVDVHGNRSAW